MHRFAFLTALAFVAPLGMAVDVLDSRTNDTTANTASYYSMSKGSCCCPTQDRILLVVECRAAHKALGVNVYREYQWLLSRIIPGGCNTRSDELHWNPTWPGRARKDMTPLCKRVSFTTTSTTTTTMPHGACWAEVYQHGDFSGWKATFTEGAASPLSTGGAVDNDASAIKVFGSGCIAEVYEYADLTGWKATFAKGAYDYAEFLSGGARNDEASGIKVFKLASTTTSTTLAATTTTLVTTSTLTTSTIKITTVTTVSTTTTASTTSQPASTTPTFDPKAIQSGDTIFLKSRAGTGNHVDVEGSAVRARWQSQGTWQALTIETIAGDALRSGGVVYLRTHTGAHLDVMDGSVQARWQDQGAWQAMVIEKRFGNGAILQDDVICLKAHTGAYLDVEDDVVRARWNECGDWQAMNIEKEAPGSLFSGDLVHLRQVIAASHGKYIDVEGTAVAARWFEAGAWQTFTITNFAGRVIHSGDVVFLQAHTGKLLHVQGTEVHAEWNDYGEWQEFVIEVNGGGPVMPDSFGFLRAHTGKYVHINPLNDDSVGAKWSERGAWQMMVFEKALPRRLTRRGNSGNETGIQWREEQDRLSDNIMIV